MVRRYVARANRARRSRAGGRSSEEEWIEDMQVVPPSGGFYLLRLEATDEC